MWSDNLTLTPNPDYYCQEFLVIPSNSQQILGILMNSKELRLFFQFSFPSSDSLEFLGIPENFSYPNPLLYRQ